MDDPLRLFASAFDTFVARTLVEGTIASDDAGSNQDDADTIENEFCGRTWHNLIYYHYSWGAMLLRWSLTDASYRQMLPSFLCASLLWPEIEIVMIAADLLAPIDRTFVVEQKTRRFHYLLDDLSGKERALVGRFLKFFLARDTKAFVDYFEIPQEEISAAVDQYWSEREIDAHRTEDVGMPG